MMAGPPQPSESRGRATDAALEAEVHRLRRAKHELEILNELALSISRAPTLDDIMGKIVRRARRAVGADEADIKIVEPSDRGGGGDPMQTIARDRGSRAGHEAVALDKRMMLGMMQAHRQPLLSNDPCHDPRLRELCRQRDVRSVLLVPMVVKSELIGILMAFNKQDEGGFTEEDQRLLSIMASQSAQLLENARLAEQERQLALVREQLRLARDIQLGLLPQAPPRIPGYDVAGVSLPAQEVGGDYFDFVPTVGGSWALCLGDVSGKGLPAALLMANLQATLRGQARFNERPEVCVTWSNRLLCQCTDPEKFTTLFYGVLDPATHELRYCNAGHERPLLLRAGCDAPESLAGGGLVLGILEDFPYAGSSLTLGPGDLLVIYSDGVTDATNRAEEPFGLQRLTELLHRASRQSAAAAVAAIVAAVREHAEGTEQADDITLVAVRRVARDGP